MRVGDGNKVFQQDLTFRNGVKNIDRVFIIHCFFCAQKLRSHICNSFELNPGITHSDPCSYWPSIKIVKRWLATAHASHSYLTVWGRRLTFVARPRSRCHLSVSFAPFPFELRGGWDSFTCWEADFEVCQDVRETASAPRNMYFLPLPQFPEHNPPSHARSRVLRRIICTSARADRLITARNADSFLSGLPVSYA